MSWLRRLVDAAVASMFVAGLLVGSVASPAVGDERAAAGWVITNPNVDGTFAVRTGAVTMTNLDNGTVISCAGADGPGEALTGSIRPNDWFGLTYWVIYQDCTGPDGVAVEADSVPWHYIAESYDAATDRVMGQVFTDSAAAFVLPPDCLYSLYTPHFEEELPRLEMIYDNPSSTLTITHDALEVADVDGAGCEGVAHNGDRVEFSATFNVTPAITVRPA